MSAATDGDAPVRTRGYINLSAATGQKCVFLTFWFVNRTRHKMLFFSRHLLETEKAADLYLDYEGGGPWKDYATRAEIWADVMDPFINLYSSKARQAGVQVGVPSLVRRFIPFFKILLGLVRPRRLDDVWVPKVLSYICCCLLLWLTLDPKMGWKTSNRRDLAW